MKACVGGTFDRLHKGHKLLLKTACSLGGTLRIGLTSDRFASRSKKREVKPYSERELALRRLLRGKRIEIAEISDMYGFAAEDRSLGAIAVSTETYENALRINQRRRKNGFPELIIAVVPIVNGDKGKKLSSGGSHGV